MNQKLKNVFLVFLILAFVGVTISLFLPKAPLLILFSSYLFIVLMAQVIGRGPVAFMMTGFTTLFGVFCLSQIPASQILTIPVLILCLWACVFLLHLHQERNRQREQNKDLQDDSTLKKIRILKKDIAYYQQRAQELANRSGSRRLLSQSARELGALLDPTEIQNKLIEKAKEIFPDRPVGLSYGQNPDAVDKFIIQKKQPVIVPGDFFKGQPALAVPVLAQRSVAGVLRVGGQPGPAFSRDDLRLLEILASLASLALDNSLLFSQVQESALRDGLTGLLTRRAFQDHIDAAILEASRYNQQVSLILTDVDHFKSINDTYGHQAGDQVLQGFAHVLFRNVRDIDVVARYGGEEFVLILYQTPHEEAMKIAEAIRIDLEAQQFGVGNQVIGITGSFGVATFPDDATTPQQLVRMADQRLYAAKKGGRNQVFGKAA